MHYLILKKELLPTFSRKNKKSNIVKFFIKNINSINFGTSLRYSLLIYFFNKNKLILNKLIVNKLFIEELASSFILKI